MLCNMLMVAPFKKTYTEAHPNAESIKIRIQFPKFCLVRCFTLSFYYTGLCAGPYIKEVNDSLKRKSGKDYKHRLSVSSP